MADTINSLRELNILFQNTVVAMLGFEKVGSPEAYEAEAWSAVRISWPTEGAPSWKVTDDVAFIQTVEDDDPYNRQKEVLYGDQGSPEAFVREYSYTRVIKLSVTLYGPNSYEKAQDIRDKMFYPEFREILSVNNLHLIPDGPAPKRNPELFQGNWWERVDLQFRFNELIVRKTEVGYIESVDIDIINHAGLQREITVERSS